MTQNKKLQNLIYFKVIIKNYSIKLNNFKKNKLCVIIIGSGGEG